MNATYSIVRRLSSDAELHVYTTDLSANNDERRTITNNTRNKIKFIEQQRLKSLLQVAKTYTNDTSNTRSDFKSTRFFKFFPQKAVSWN